MSMVVNNNMMAANTARNLNAHYGRLATSTQRLSSGLRINSAADDAAGLAIRELQRADIAALHQGARNANDAISMIQVADGSLGIIDEKLIRMKELAEQAATGTYDSTQRLMIESEYQAMASEITRIANATDFNGTKLLDGTLHGDHDGSGMVSEGKMKVHFGTGNDSAEDYYYIEIDECTSEAFGLGNNSTWQDVQRRGMNAFKDSLLKQIKADETLSDDDRGKLLAQVDAMTEQVDGALSSAVDYKAAYKLLGMTDGNPDNYQLADDQGFLKDGKIWVTNSTLMEKYLTAAASAVDVNDIITADDQIVKDTANKISAAINGSIADAVKMSQSTDTTPQIKNENRSEVIGRILQAARDASQPGTMDTTQLQNLLEQKWDATMAGNDQATASRMRTELQSVVNAFDNDSNEPQLKNDIAAAALSQQRAKLVQNKNEMADAIGNDGIGIGTAYQYDDRVAENLTQSVNDAISDVMTNGANRINSITDPNAQKAFVAQLKEDTINAAKTAFIKAAEPATVSEEEVEKIVKAVGDAWGTTNPTTQSAIISRKNSIIDPTTGWVAQNNVQTSVVNNVASRKAAEDVLKSTSTLDDFWNSLRETERQKLQYAFGHAALYNLANAPDSNIPTNYGLDVTKPLDFAGLADVNDPNGVVKGMLDQALDDMYAKVGHMDFAGHTVETQEDAQMALDAINEAIVSKDKIRAHLGAAQNRLENTVSNLNIQAENLQAAESRISDVDVATEMTQFVRNQILTQSAVAMLSQANSLPQMAMQLIGG